MNNGLDQKALLARVEDVARLCEKQYSAKCFGFLTPAEAALISRTFKASSLDEGFNFKFFGGYNQAERCLFLVYPEYVRETVDEEFISLIEITGRDIETLSHRDFLGSILSLGIKREKIGDIVCLEDKCLVFAMSDIADYITSNLVKIANCGVKAQICKLKDAEVPNRKFEEIRTTVASLRLDSIIGAALKTSRRGAAEVISARRVSVNWQEVYDVSAKVAPGDVFSVRGAGRFRLAREINETRKGRLGICIEKAV